MAEQAKNKFKLFVGIDFGTDGSGIAYCVKESEAAYIHNMWDGQKATEKTKTSVLFDENGGLIKAGSGSKAMYLGCDEDKGWKLFETFKMSLYEELADKSKIKQSEQKMDFVELKQEIETTNDQNVKESSETVFVAQLKYLKKEAFKFIENHFANKLGLSGNAKSGWPEVQYFLTVPAIWSDKAKDMMVKWSIKAGLIDNKIKDQLKIVYEPDCASLSIQHAIVRGMNDKKKKKKKKKGLQSLSPQIDINVSLQAGDKYILCDCGGGTVDVACHEIMGKFSIAEVMHPSGGKWGGKYIDEAFISLLGELFTNNLLNIFKMCGGKTSYLKLLNYFVNKSKKSFFNEYPAEIPPYHDIQMPSTFVTFVGNEFFKNFREGNELDVGAALKDFNERLAKLSKRFKENDVVAAADPGPGSSQLIDTQQNDEKGGNDANKEKVKYAKMKKRDRMIKIIYAEDDEDDDAESEDKESDSDAPNYEEDFLLSMHRNVWQYLFDSIINPIIGHCKKILSEKAMKDTKYIFLVGGFAKNKYFQMRMKKEFEANKNCKVFIPGLPQLCVVDGAARYGLDPNFVKIRRMPRTYGVDIHKSKTLCVEQGYPKEYIKNNSYVNEESDQDYVEDCFSIFVKKGQEVRLDGKPIVQEFQKVYENQKVINLPIYSSIKANPLSVKEDGAIKLGYVHVPMPNDVDDVTCEFTFSTNLLTVNAYPKGQPSRRKQCKVEYL